MVSTKKNGSADKAMNRPLPSSRALDDGDDSTAMVLHKNETSVMASNSAKISPDKVAKSKAPFRYRWQKNGRFEYQEALIKADYADNTEDKRKAIHTKKSDTTDDEESDTGTIVHQYGGKRLAGPAPDANTNEESDVEFKQEEGSDDEYEGTTRSRSKKPIGSAPKKQQYQQKKNLKPAANGRVVGRKLVMWHRPRMVEKLMLHLQYECHRGGIKLPWNKAVERLSIGSSGVAAQQHLNKLRDVLITEGHMVPPLLGKYTVPQDPTIRGYVRDMDAEKPTDTRVVRWGEKTVDPKENLEVEGVIRGSGNYRRGLSKALEKAQKATGERRNRLPVELRDKESPPVVSNTTAGTKKKVVKRSASVISSRADSLDPAEMDSEEDYDPIVANKKGKYGLRRAARPMGKYKTEDSDDEVIDETDEEITEPIRGVVAAAIITPQAKRFKESDNDYGLITPPSNKPVILNLRPELLKRFPSGTCPKNAVVEGEAALVINSGDEMELDGFVENGSVFSADEYDSEGGKYGMAAAQYPHTPVGPLAQQMARYSGYQGTAVHGLKSEFDEAIRNGLNPNINGFANKKKSPVANSQIFGDAESRVSSAYKLSAPPTYAPTSASRQSHSNNSLAGSSAGAFPTYTGGTNVGSPVSSTGYEAYMNGLGRQRNYATPYGNVEHMAVGTSNSRNDHYTSGTDLFGNSPFDNAGVDWGNYDGNNDAQGHFDLSVGLGSNNYSSARAPAAISSALAFQVAANNNPDQFTNDFQNNGDTVSEARSSPAHFVDFNSHEVDDNKENREYYGY